VTSPGWKDATMTTQKTFKRRIRGRMAKTGESYTTARRQLLEKAPTPDAATTATDPAETQAPAVDPAVMLTSDEAMIRATGRDHAAWFGILDAWGGTAHGHTAIAAWLIAEQQVAAWWAQTITVAYERARGMRAAHQVAGKFQVSVNRTLPARHDRVLAAFTDPALRERWLPGVTMTQRRTTAERTARFDWPEPPSRVVVYLDVKGPAKSTVSVMHDRLPDAAAGARMKAWWREQLGALGAMLATDETNEQDTRTGA
jgi:hypothetical protein